MQSKKDFAKTSGEASMTNEAGKTFTAWLWKHLEDDFLGFLNRKFKDTKEKHEQLKYAADDWMAFQWGAAAERYKAHMKTLYGHIRVLGSTEPVNLEEIYTDVYILDKPLAYRRFDITQLHKLQLEPEKLDEIKRIPGLRMVLEKRGHRLYILGKPGAGKTTFLRYLVHQTLRANFDKIPIFIILKDWADSKLDMLPYIAREFDTCRFPHAQPFIEYVLEMGKAIVLFDGLDEVQLEGKQRNYTTSAVHQFCKKYLETQILITCRVAANDYSFAEFTYVEIADFTDPQMEYYAHKWFGKSILKANNFISEFKSLENKSVRELGRSPLFLSMICLIYDETLHIPKRRVDFYEEALDALLKKWDDFKGVPRDKIYENLSLSSKNQMFSWLAAGAFDKGEIFFNKKQLAQQIADFIKNFQSADNNQEPDGEAVLRAIEAHHGIMVERALGIYAFAHLTFQEYYAAKYIADNVEQGTLPVLMEHLTDPRWREVLLLTASLLKEGDGFFSAMHRSTGNLIRKDNMLIEISHWVKQKTKDIDGYHSGAVRGVYWFFALAYDLAFFLANYYDFSLPLGLALAMSKDLDRTLAQALSDVRPLDKTLRKKAFDRARVLILARELASTLDVTIDYMVDYAIEDALNRVLVIDLGRAYSLGPVRAIDRARPLYVAGLGAPQSVLESKSAKKILLTALLLYASIFIEILTWEKLHANDGRLRAYLKKISAVARLSAPNFALAFSKLTLPSSL